MTRLRTQLALLVALVLSLFALPVWADAPDTTWEDPVHGTTLYLETLSVDREVVYAGESFKVSVDAEAPDGVYFRALGYVSVEGSSSSGRNHAIELRDEDRDGTYEGEVLVQEGFGTGTFTVSSLDGYDESGHIFTIYNRGAGWPAEGNFADLTAIRVKVDYVPQDTFKPYVDLSTLSVEPKTATARDDVTLSLVAYDDYQFGPGGITGSVSYVVEQPDGTMYYPSASLADEDGDGVLTATLSGNQLAYVGTWTARNMSVTDAYGNVTYYSSDPSRVDSEGYADLSGLDFAVEAAPAGPSDTEPPIIDLSQSGLIIERDPAQPGDVVIVRTHVTDNVGVSQVMVYMKRNGGIYRPYYCEDRGDGVWEVSINLDPGYSTGSYGICAIGASDEAGNQLVYQSEAFPAPMGELVDLSFFDFDIGVPTAAQPPEPDLATVGITPRSATRYQSIHASFTAEGVADVQSVSVYYEFTQSPGSDGTVPEEKSRNGITFYTTSRDGDDYVAIGAVSNHTYIGQGDFHAIRATFTNADNESVTYVAPGSGLEGEEADLSAFDLTLTEPGSVEYRTRPIASTATCSGGTVAPGDTVHFELDVEGERPANRAELSLVREGTNVPTFDVPLTTEDGWHFEGDLTVTDGYADGEWYTYNVRVFDRHGCYYDMRHINQSSGYGDSRADLSALRFAVDGSTAVPDIGEPPVPLVGGSRAVPRTVTADDTIRLEVRATSDDPTWDVFVCYKRPNSTYTYAFFQLNGQGYCSTERTSQSLVSLSQPGLYYCYAVELRNKYGTRTIRDSDPMFAEYGFDQLSYTIVDDEDALSLSKAIITLDATNYVYDGTEKVPSATVTLDGVTLREGTDYDLAYTDNLNAGVARVTAIGKGEYIGKCTATYTIHRRNIEEAVVGDIPAMEYVPDYGPDPEVTVTLDGRELVRGTDYTVAVVDNQVAGVARANIVGTGNYQGKIAISYEVTALDISGAEAQVDDVAFDGGDESPRATVTLDGRQLVLGKDFVVELQKQDDVGIATAIVRGIRGCIGQVSQTINVTKGDISAGVVRAEDAVWTGSPVTTDVTVTLGKNVLVEGADYELEYLENTNVGTATVVAHGIGNYEGEVRGTFRIGSDVNAATIGEIEPVTYSGEEWRPEPTLTLGDATLTRNVDYSLAFRDNVNAGTATITIRGKGSYVGEREVTFEIAPLDIGTILAPEDDPMWTVQYDRARAIDLPKIRFGTQALMLGTDYIAIPFGMATGTGGDPSHLTVGLIGRGNFTGQAQRVLTVLPYLIQDGDFVLEEIPNQVYTGQPVEPAVTVRPTFGTMIQYGDEQFANRTVSYRDNVKVGTATAIVTYDGLVVGSVQGTFGIGSSLAGATVTASKPYDGVFPHRVAGGEAVEPAVTVTLDGTRLTQGADFRVVAGPEADLDRWRLTDPEMPGAHAITVEGVGAYAGTATGTYTIYEPFRDVTPRTAHYEDVLWMSATGISKGWGEYPSCEFRPMNNITRCDMAAFLYRLAGEPEFEPTAADLSHFTDVSKSTPHYKEVLWMYSAGISTGYANKNGTFSFRPYGNVYRCDMAAFLCRMAGQGGYVASGFGSFADVSSRTSHANEIVWLAQTGVSTGYPDGTFRPMDTVKRQDMAAFLHRMYEKGLVS